MPPLLRYLTWRPTHQATDRDSAPAHRSSSLPAPSARSLSRHDRRHQFTPHTAQSPPHVTSSGGWRLLVRQCVSVRNGSRSGAHRPAARAPLPAGRGASERRATGIVPLSTETCGNGERESEGRDRERERETRRDMREREGRKEGGREK